MTPEQQVRVAAELYEARDACRQLMGDKYVGHMADLGKHLKAIAERKEKEPSAVAVEICNARNLVGMDAMMILAAAVELMAPTGGKT